MTTAKINVNPFASNEREIPMTTAKINGTHELNLDQLDQVSGGAYRGNGRTRGVGGRSL